jgi:UDP-N-acetylmuramyl pentapeptide phosphotransferase/UDP-N-acetylglucosamine-1-phosphate transferase
MQTIFIAIAAGLLGWGLTGLVLQGALRAQHLAPPTDRGLHKTPTPVGGGLGMIAAALVVWLLSFNLTGSVSIPLLISIAILSVVSWIDDRHPLPPIVRFAAQGLVVALLLWALAPTTSILPVLPHMVEYGLLAIAWLWVINLTNFMDGIDGLAGTEAITVGLGYVLFIVLVPHQHQGLPDLPELALALAAAAAGYLIWNWHPARIFMGDVGAIPLGLLFGLFMLDLARRGQWAAALILPMYFLADATLTLLERLQRGAKPWQAHREHAYQRAVLSGMSHSAVTCHVAVLNVALIALAILSGTFPRFALLVAFGLTCALLSWFRTRPLPSAE